MFEKFFSWWGYYPCLVCKRLTKKTLCSPECETLYDEALEYRASMDSDSLRCDHCGGFYCSSRCDYHDVIPEEGGCEAIDRVTYSLSVDPEDPFAEFSNEEED